MLQKCGYFACPMYAFQWSCLIDSAGKYMKIYQISVKLLGGKAQTLSLGPFEGPGDEVGQDIDSKQDRLLPALKAAAIDETSTDKHNNIVSPIQRFIARNYTKKYECLFKPSL